MSTRPEKVTVVPAQDSIVFEVSERDVKITQESISCGDQTITIIGPVNVDLMIFALQKVRELWS